MKLVMLIIISSSLGVPGEYQARTIDGKETGTLYLTGQHEVGDTIIIFEKK